MKPLRLARLLAAARWGDIDLETGGITLGPDERNPFRVRPRRREETGREARNREAVRSGHGLVSLDVPPPVPSHTHQPADSPPEDYDG